MKILVAYRKDKVDREVMDIAVKHAKAFGGKILITTSLKGRSSTSKIHYQDKIDAEKNLELANAYFENCGVQCETHLLIRGLDAGEDIVLFAKEKGVDEVIMSVKKRSKVGKMLFGSTAQFVILESHCPVLAVK